MPPVVRTRSTSSADPPAGCRWRWWPWAAAPSSGSRSSACRGWSWDWRSSFLLTLVWGMDRGRRRRRGAEGAAPQRAARSATGARQEPSARGVGAASLLLVAAAAVPLLGAVLHAALGTRCGPFAQAGFYPLLVIACGGASPQRAGTFCRTAFAARLPAIALYVLLVLASVAWTAWPLMPGPQVYAFNFFLGYVPRPALRRGAAAARRAVWFRLETLLWAVAARRMRGRASSRLPDLHTAGTGAAARALPGPRGGADPRHGARTRSASACAAPTPRCALRSAAGRRPSTRTSSSPARSRPRRWSGSGATWSSASSSWSGSSARRRPRCGCCRVPLARGEAALVGAGSTQFAKPWLAERVPQRRALPSPHAQARAGPRRGRAPSGADLSGSPRAVAGAGDGRGGGSRGGRGRSSRASSPLHGWAAGMRRQGLLPDLRRFSGRRLLEPPRRHAPTSLPAAFSAGFEDTQGTAKFQRLLAHGDFAGTYGRGPGGALGANGSGCSTRFLWTRAR